MAYSLSKFFAEIALPPMDAERLARRCEEAGLTEVVDLSLVEPDMVPLVLRQDTESLGPTLREAAKWAEKVAEGWARGENMRGGGAAGRGRASPDDIVGGGPAAIRTPGRDSPNLVVVAAPAGACPKEARGEVPAVVRSSRLLRAFTVRTLKRGVKRNRSTGPPQNRWRSWSP